MRSATSAIAIAARHKRPNSLTAGVLLRAIMANPATSEKVDVMRAGAEYLIAVFSLSFGSIEIADDGRTKW